MTEPEIKQRACKNCKKLFNESEFGTNKISGKINLNCLTCNKVKNDRKKESRLKKKLASATLPQQPPLSQPQPPAQPSIYERLVDKILPSTPQPIPMDNIKIIQSSPTITTEITQPTSTAQLPIKEPLIYTPEQRASIEKLITSKTQILGKKSLNLNSMSNEELLDYYNYVDHDFRQKMGSSSRAEYLYYGLVKILDNNSEKIEKASGYRITTEGLFEDLDKERQNLKPQFDLIGGKSEFVKVIEANPMVAIGLTTVLAVFGNKNMDKLDEKYKKSKEIAPPQQKPPAEEQKKKIETSLPGLPNISIIKN